MGTKVQGNERSWERKFQERKFQELSFHDNKSSRERKGPGTKVPWHFRSSGTKVLHRDLSFLGTKGLGYEKSVIPAACPGGNGYEYGYTYLQYVYPYV